METNGERGKKQPITGMSDSAQDNPDVKGNRLAHSPGRRRWRRETRFVLTLSLLFLNVGIWTQVLPALMSMSADGEVLADGDLEVRNGFDISNATIPRNEIVGGGPPRDGIPAIMSPKFLRIDDVDFLQAQDLVLSVVVGDQARAYPLRILVWHEIVNDTFEGKPLAVTYCPLCGTAMVFERKHGSRTLTFGVSGLLYNSDVLMYDHQTESLWSQLKMEAISGPLVGEELMWLPSTQMVWESWKRRYPHGEVLSTDTGYPRFYHVKPYARYEAQEEPVLPVRGNRQDLPNKEWIVGVIVNGVPKAYPVDLLTSRNHERLADMLGGRSLEIHWDSGAKSFEVYDGESKNAIPSVQAYWFAWQAFYPDTQLWKSDR